ncbi:MAG: hypothetical protein AAFN92_04415, partial [Bacteroidota bacterium]
ALYGGLAVAEIIRTQAGLSAVLPTRKTPFIGQRGIKFNIPLDARTPSYSDNNAFSQATLPDVWNMDFWEEYLDEMARNRLNLLTMWSLHPFPSIVKVPEYPRVGLDDVTRTRLPVSEWGRSSSGADNAAPEVLAQLDTVRKIKLDGKIRFWQEVMQYAHDRGVDIYFYTWNVFVFGAENAGYGITDDMDNPVTRDYLRRATTALLKTYPLLKGLGITAGENMYHHEDDRGDADYLFETYGRGVNDALAEAPDRRFQLIFRLGDPGLAKEAFTDLHPRAKLAFCHKYSKAHVYSSVDPYWIHDHKFLETITDSSDFYVTIRDDTHYYLRGGSDPSWTREYLRNIPNRERNFRGFQLGADGIAWGREAVSKHPTKPRQQVLQKRWYSMRIWGSLAYDPSLPDAHFRRLLAQRFPEVAAVPLYRAWATASGVVPLVNRFHNHKAYLDYQWNPELCDSRPGYNSETGFHDIATFLKVKVQPEEGLIGIPAFVAGVSAGTTPWQVVDELHELSARTLGALDQLDTSAVTDRELRETLGDIRALGWLGRYYAHKIAATTHYAFYEKTGDEPYRAATIRELQAGSTAWWEYAHQLRQQYVPFWYGRLRKTVDVLETQQHVDREITNLGGQIPARPRR